MAKFLACPTLAASSLARTTPLTVSIEPVVLLSIRDRATHLSKSLTINKIPKREGESYPWGEKKINRG
jgi:hypothetical protein